jgi:hypothetical protein
MIIPSANDTHGKLTEIDRKRRRENLRRDGASNAEQKKKNSSISATTHYVGTEIVEPGEANNAIKKFSDNVSGVTRVFPS